MKVTVGQLDELLICTVRYYLGRGSIAALTFPDANLSALLGFCSDLAQGVILRDITGHAKAVDEGREREVFKGDIDYWKKFLEKIPTKVAP